MAIEVTRPGLLATIQDKGRFGMQKYGVVVSGAQDIFSLQVANLLVGNELSEAVIEIAMYGSSYIFTKDHMIAITGADLQPMLDGKPVPLWRPIFVPKGSEIIFGSAKHGCYAYVAIAGGLNIETQYGSKSTYIRANIGGVKGRALQKKDKISIGKLTALQSDMFAQLLKKDQPPSWFVKYDNVLPFAETETLYVLKGSEINYFTEESINQFIENEYMLTPRADRMGYAFQGSELKRRKSKELLSEGVTFGTVQVPSSGQPIILMADRQTTGGYPKLAQVISAHLPRLSQLKPKQYVRFQFVTIEEAEKAYIEMYRYIYELKRSIEFRVCVNSFAD